MASNSTGSDKEFGFFYLGLRIFQVRDENQLEYLRDEQLLEAGCCHNFIEPVTKNFVCMIKYQIPGEKTDAINDLEQAAEKFPNNLNILANLAAVYRSKLENQKEQEILKKITKICTSDMGKVEIARSQVEQGYVMMIDLHSETRGGIEKTVMALKKQLEESGRFSKGRIERMRNENILALIVEVQKQLLGVPSDCFRETTQERALALEKLENGVKSMMDFASGTIDTTEMIVWKHYLGKAYMRVSGGSNEITSPLSKTIFVEKSAETFVEVANFFENEPTDKFDSILLSRSYAYLVYLCTQKRYALSKSQKLASMVVKGIVVNKNPEDLIKLVTRMNETYPDRVALNKIGIIYTHDSEWDKAEEILTKSIKEFKQCNWYAYSWLCYMFLQKHVGTVKGRRTKRGENLESRDLMKAKKFGKQALDMRKTSLTLYRMAKVSNYLGETEEAIGYLRDALNTHECERHPAIYSLLGFCLYQEGQTEDAFRMMKIATTLEPKNQKDPLIYRDFLLLLLDMFRKNEKNPEFGQSNKRRDLEMICCVMEEGHRKHKMRIKFQTIEAINKYPHEMIEVMLVMLKQTFTERSKTIITMCIEALKHHKGSGVKRRCSKLEEIYQTRLESPINQQDTDGDHESQSNEGTSPTRSEYHFDYYILFPQSARRWIKNIYLDALGSDHNARGQLLKGRTCEPSDNAADVLSKCKKLVIVVTEDFEEQNNLPIKTLAQQFVKMGIERKGDIIPVLRDVSEIPDFLEVIESCGADDLHKVRNAILGYNDSIRDDSIDPEPEV